jgi:hypothetical protein
MPFTPTEKEKFLGALLDTRNAAQTGEIRLRFQQQTAEADKAIVDLGKRSAAVDDAIASIKKKVKLAQSVTKLVGGLDDAVAIAKKVLMAA